MALSFDDRILGEKVDNYCSSGDEANEGDSGDEGGQQAAQSNPSVEPPQTFQNYSGHAANTGPKGVLNDYEAFQKMERRKARETEKLKVELAKKCTMACRTVRDDADAVALDEKLREELDAQEDDFENDIEREFLAEYRRKRIEEMRQALANLPKYGKVMELTRASFVKEIDDAVHHRTTVIVLIYADPRSCESENALACARLSEALEVIAREYTTAKVCRIEAREASVSKRFARRGVPALLIYKHGELIGNFVAVHRELGAQRHSSSNDASSGSAVSSVLGNPDLASELETFLLEFGYLPERTSALPPPISSTQASASNQTQSKPTRADHSDSDDDSKAATASSGRKMRITQYSKRAADSDSDDSD